MTNKGRLLNLEEIQTALFDILVAFDGICSEYDIKYSLGGGTLLGAIRHKGFIPWDDDIDIIMPRDDYINFISLDFPLSKNGLKLDIENHRNRKSPLAFTKLVNLEINASENNNIATDFLWIDIFPADLVNDALVTDFKLQKARKYNLIAWKLLSYDEDMSLRRRAAIKINRLYRNFFSSLFVEKAETIYKSLTGSQNDYYLDLTWHNFFGGGMIIKQPLNDFKNMQYAEFNDRHFPIINSWDNYLTKKYGDYMRLPAKNQRVSHGVKAWAK